MWFAIVDFCKNQFFPSLEDIGLVFSALLIVCILLAFLIFIFGCAVSALYWKIREHAEINNIARLVRTEEQLKIALKELEEWERNPYTKASQRKKSK